MLDRIRGAMPGGDGFGPAKGGGPGGAMPGGGASTGQEAIGGGRIGVNYPEMMGGLSDLGRQLGRGSASPMAPAPMPIVMPNNMTQDAARKIAQGMPAHLLDPNYKAGSRK